jgi:hypothetical protein
VQQLALAAALGQKQKQEHDRDWRGFILAAVAAHPERAARLLKLLDGDEEREPGAFAEPFMDEDLETYVPLQERGEEFRNMLGDLQRLGFSVTED